MKKTSLLIFSLLLSLCFSVLFAQPQSEVWDKLEDIAHIDQKVMMPMRDGIRLATDIYRPKTDQKVPIIFYKTPYNFNTWGDGEINERHLKRALEAVEHGYAFVVQNERGKFFSEGEYDILGVPLTDGYDAFSWLEKQDWCNGRIGTYGCSSTAEWQMAVGALGHPAHKAMVPMGYGAGVGRVGEFYEQGNWYRGGAEQLLFYSWLYSVDQVIKPSFPSNLSQEDLIKLSRMYDLVPEMPKVDWKKAFYHLPLSEMLSNVEKPQGIFDKMIVRKPNDKAWYKGGLYHDNMNINIPSFWFVSWYDVSVAPNLALVDHVKETATDATAAANQYLVIAPVVHCAYMRATEETMVGNLNVGDARLDYDALIYGWFDFWLKDNKSDFLNQTPKVQYYTLGANQWQQATTWPPEGVEMETWYLRSNGRANSLYGDGYLSKEKPSEKETADAFSYDPENPVPSLGGNVCCTGGAIDAGSYDQRPVEVRHDVLVYSTPPLEEGMEVSGPLEVTLYVSSDVKDTDFTVKLVDVHPDGSAYNLDETIQRARYREGYDKEVFMENGEVYEVKMSPLTTSNYFKKGHQLRIEVSSSNFPRFSRNLNTGGNNFDEEAGVVANNKVHHSGVYASKIEVAVVKDSKVGD